jgi:myosin-5
MGEALPGVSSKFVLFGKTKVFLKMEAYNALETWRVEIFKKKVEAANVIKTYLKGRLQRKKYVRLRRAIVVLQGLWRVRAARLDFLTKRRSVRILQRWFITMLQARALARLTQTAVRLQEYARAKSIRLRYLGLRQATRFIQAMYRRHLENKRRRRDAFIQSLVGTVCYKTAWRRVILFIHNNSATTIQRHWRGYWCRRLHSRKIAMIKAAIRQRREEKAVITIQTWFRGELVRLRLRRLIASVCYIQGFFKARWLYALFKKVMQDIKRIQRTFRAFSLRRQVTQERLNTYILSENSKHENMKVLEASELFSRPDLSVSSDLNSRYLATVAESAALMNKLALTSTGSVALQSKPVSPFHLERLYLFTRVLDLDLLTDSSLVYEPTWSRQYETFHKESVVREEQVMDVVIGSCHSIAVTSRGKVFVWGWSDKGQCGGVSNAPRPKLLDCEGTRDKRVVQITAGDDHSLILNSKGTVSAFGDNSKGQLGLGHYGEVIGVVAVEGLPPGVTQVASSGSQNFAVTEAGAAFMWPYETLGKEKRSIPIAVLIETSVTEVAAGNNFALLLTSSGLVYSFGINNHEGQQGHGDCEARITPELILSLKNAGEKVTGVACGFLHSICRTSLGKVYTWGWGGYGQLGHGSLSSELSPRLLQMSPTSQRYRAVQCAAGYRHSVLMLEGNKLVWFGTNSSQYYTQWPVEVDLASRLPEFFSNKDFLPIRVLCSWSKSLSLTVLTIVDCRYVKQTKTQLAKTLGVLVNKWSSRNSKG